MTTKTASSSLILALIVISAIQFTSQTARSLAHRHLDLKGLDEVTTTATPAAEDAIEPKESCGLPLYRLPDNIQPHHYELLLMPDIDNETFEGAVQISISTNSSQGELPLPLVSPNQIVLHAGENLEIENVWFIDQTNKQQATRSPALKLNKQLDATLNQLLLEKKPPKLQTNTTNATNNNNKQQHNEDEDEHVKVVKVCREAKYQLVVLTLERDLKPNTRGLLHLTFAGNLSKYPNLFGMYLSSWFADAAAGRNESGRNVVTQLQSTHARKMFPCFDEPALKATFELHLVYPANKSALANTLPVFEQSLMLPAWNNSTATNETTPTPTTQEQEYKLVRFARTPPMSTYLLAFTVGDYEFIEGHVQLNTKKVRVRVYTAPSKLPRAQFALQATLKSMKALSKLFEGDEYPLDKIDLVGIRDFSEAAMENWGLVTFKEEYLLFDPKNSSPQRRAQVVSTIIHELAHQWFGNSVTMSWWNDIWLNEGFATWFESKVLAEVYPEYDHLYLVESHVKSLESDHMRDASPVRQKNVVLLESHIDSLFSYAGYHKPASVIRMLESSWRKWSNFWPLMKGYLEVNKYKSVGIGQLLDAWMRDKNLPANFTSATTSWLEQPGYPVISLSVNGSRLDYHQQRLIKHTKELSEGELAQVWLTPVRVSLFDGKKVHTEFYFLNATRGSIELPIGWQSSKSPNKWIKFNKDFDGHYVTRYSDELFRALISAPAQLSSHDRINLLEESTILFNSKRLGVDKLLALMQEVGKQEKNGAVLVSLTRAYDSLGQIFNRQNSTLSRELGDFGRRIFGDRIFKQFPREILAAKSEGQSAYWDWIGRTSVFERLIQLDYKPAIARALQLFDESSKSAGVSVNMREPIYFAVARNGSEPQFVRLLKIYAESGSLEHKQLVLESLFRASSRDRLAQSWKLLTESVMDDKMIEQLDESRLSPLITMTRDRTGRDFLLDLLAGNYSDIVDLNEDESLAPLLEELYLNAAPEELAELNRTVMKLDGDQVSDWPSSLEWILQIIEWRTSLRRNSELAFESALRTIQSAPAPTPAAAA